MTSTESKVENKVSVNDKNTSQVHTFQMRSAPNQKFKTHIAKEVIQETLNKYLNDREYSQIQTEILSKNIATEIKDRLKDLCLESRYKLIVQVIIGERGGAGIKSKCRCIWDADADTLAYDQFLNETIFCSAILFGVYFC